MVRKRGGFLGFFTQTDNLDRVMLFKLRSQQASFSQGLYYPIERFYPAHSVLCLRLRGLRLREELN